jgi:hypothetical protein
MATAIAEEVEMVIPIHADLEAALTSAALKQGVSPEDLAVAALRQRFLPRPLPFEPRDEWERGLFAAAVECGVSLSDEAVSSEGLYD